jgi:hypothetical protein
MRVAILGADAATLRWARTLVSDSKYKIALACEVTGPAANEYCKPLREALAGVRISETWEDLLDPALAAVVLVASGPPAIREEQLRKLTQAKIPLLVAFPPGPGMLICHELEMIRDDLDGVIFPDLIDRLHPLIGELTWFEKDAIQAGHAQVTIERQLAHRDATTTQAALARDVDLCQLLFGEILRLSALGAGEGEERFDRVGVQMVSRSGVVIRWSVAPVTNRAGGTLTVVAGNSTATLSMPDAGDWSLTTPNGTSSHPQSEWNPACIALDQLCAATNECFVQPSWYEATRALEVAQAMPRSLEKGRTVELVFEEYSEEGTFKARMASLGCGLLLVALAVMPLAGLLGSLFTPSRDEDGGLVREPGRWQTLMRSWPWLLLALAVVFLLLQMLSLVFRHSTSAGEESNRAKFDD